MEIFKNQREFNKKFPSKIYICTKCQHPTPNPYFCVFCKNQSNNFLYKGYKYTILDKNITETIFLPTEIYKRGTKCQD